MSNPHSHPRPHTKNDHRRSNTLPSRTSTASPRAFDLGLIIRNRKNSTTSTKSKSKTSSSTKPPNLDIEKEQEKQRERSNIISHTTVATATTTTSPRRFPTLGAMPHKLLKRQKDRVQEGKGDGKSTNLHQTPTSSTTLPLSPASPRRAPSQIHRLQVHRRSRSFSELLNSLSSISGKPQQLTSQDQHQQQPWRSREAWLALHSQRLQYEHERASDMPPIRLQSTGAWRQRSRAELFGTDMSVPLPSYRSGRKPSSVRKVSLEEGNSPINVDVKSTIDPSKPVNGTTKLTTQLGTLGPALTLHTSTPSPSRQRLPSHSPSSSSSSSDSGSPSGGGLLTTWQTPPQYTAVDNDDDDLLPPLLPARHEPGSPSSLGGSPPWAQSGTRSGRASPSASLRLRTPTSPHPFFSPTTRGESVPSPSPLGSGVQKGRHTSPSRHAATAIDSMPPLPHTPPRGAMRPQTSRRSTSPRSAIARQEDNAVRHQETPKSQPPVQPQTPESQPRSSKKFRRRKARGTIT